MTEPDTTGPVRPLPDPHGPEKPPKANDVRRAFDQITATTAAAAATIAAGYQALTDALNVEYVAYGYIKPRRCRSRTPRYTRILRRAGIKRLWLRYVIIRWTYTSGPLSLATVGDSRVQSTVAGYAWTRRKAEHAVDALRRAAP